MRQINTLIIGGGQAGLALSKFLRDSNVEHVIIERGRIAERWRSQRWESLRLLTPNWQSRLPGMKPFSDDLSGYMSKDELVSEFEAYAREITAPVEEKTCVENVRRVDDGFHIATSRASWLAKNVVIATGYCDCPRIPSEAANLSPEIVQVAPDSYRRPSDLPPGGVLVVGASSTGVQLSQEIHASGRPVTLSVGRHLRLPRQYRGRDILDWFESLGILDETTDEVADIARSRNQPSLQLAGQPDRRNLDLGTLMDAGVKLVGRFDSADDAQVRFRKDLAATLATSERKMTRLLERIDSYISSNGLSRVVPAKERPTPIACPVTSGELNLDEQRIESVVWATGYQRSYSWLDIDVVDAHGELVHEGGITEVPGLYALGLNFMRTRRSTYIGGIGEDARVLSRHIASTNTRGLQEGRKAA